MKYYNITFAIISVYVIIPLWLTGDLERTALPLFALLFVTYYAARAVLNWRIRRIKRTLSPTF